MIPSDFLPPWKAAMGDKIELSIAHWTLWGPKRSGLYETVKELALYESNIPGVFGFMVDAQRQSGGKIDPSDSRMGTYAHNYAMKWADIHLIHFSHTPYGERLQPKAFMIHGTPEACLHGEMNNPGGHSFTAALHWIQHTLVSFVMCKRHFHFWKPFDHEDRLHLVPRGIDLQRWRPEGMSVDFGSHPAIGYGEVWREIKSPAVTFYGVKEYVENYNNQARFYPWGLGEHRKLWHEFIMKGDFDKLFAELALMGVQEYPEHYYRGLDMLISPVYSGEPSRAAVEALACGCPVVSWDTDNFGDNHAQEKAHAFDPYDMAKALDRLWKRIEKDPTGLRREVRHVAEQHHNMAKMAEEVVKVCKLAVEDYQNKRTTSKV